MLWSAINLSKLNDKFGKKMVIKYSSVKAFREAIQGEPLDKQAFYTLLYDHDFFQTSADHSNAQRLYRLYELKCLHSAMCQMLSLQDDLPKSTVLFNLVKSFPSLLSPKTLDLLLSCRLKTDNDKIRFFSLSTEQIAVLKNSQWAKDNFQAFLAVDPCDYALLDGEFSCEPMCPSGEWLTRLHGKGIESALKSGLSIWRFNKVVEALSELGASASTVTVSNQ